MPHPASRLRATPEPSPSRPRRALYALFFLSGVSGLVYQVVWVRAFGNVFGNTMYSASVVVAVFMCGLGVGAYGAGVWADRRAAKQPRSLLRLYGYAELSIAVLALAVSSLLPHLGALSTAFSSYQIDALGWHRLSPGSHIARVALAVVLLGPITLSMGSTLTLLIRFRVGSDLGSAGREIGSLYGINTVGAALGCILTDFAFIPLMGLQATQGLAVLLNLFAGLAALRLAKRAPEASTPSPAMAAGAGGWVVGAMTASLLFSGVAAIGVELLWLRHLGCILGSYRAVFSLMLAVMLAGFSLGAVAGGALSRALRQPVALYAGAQAAFAITMLYGLATVDASGFLAKIQAAKPAFLASSGWEAQWLQLELNLGLIAPEVLLPAISLGLAYPLANAVVQSVAGDVGRRAGLLYLGNTLGNVAGSLLVGFLLLPRAGMQGTASLLALATVVGLVCAAGVLLLDRHREPIARPTAAMFAISLGLLVMSLALWVRQPPDALLSKTLPPLEWFWKGSGERLLTVNEGLTDVIEVTQLANGDRALYSDGHPMAGTAQQSQRYMRAFAHLPLLFTAANPDSALVICFGVGNTAHAALLHKELRRLDVVDISDNVLEHAGYFRATNGDVLKDPRVSVYVNDGRQHLRMQPEQTYDLVTMEPPPLATAAAAGLYSREFYALVRSRLKPGGYLTQWLPAYQMPGDATRAVIRAFVDTFPAAVLLSGARSELILMGTVDATLTVDPARVAARLDQAPAVALDLRRIDLGTLPELLGTFAASATTLTAATSQAPPVTDDEPLIDHVARSHLIATWIPPEIFDVSRFAEFCPGCSGYAGLEHLPAYLSVLATVYRNPLFLEQVQYGTPPPPPVRFAAEQRAVIESSGYLRELFGRKAPAG